MSEMAERVDRDMHRVIDAASHVYRPEGVLIWLTSSNALLDDRSPVALVADGDTERVLDCIQGMAEGVTS